MKAVFFKRMNGFFFENIWALEQFFFVKYPKKGHPIHFFGHNV